MTGIGGSINESKFDRRNAICREVLSLPNTDSMKESEVRNPQGDFRTVFGRVSDVKESVR